MFKRDTYTNKNRNAHKKIMYIVVEGCPFRPRIETCQFFSHPCDCFTVRVKDVSSEIASITPWSLENLL